jgi:hypothetical protein
MPVSSKTQSFENGKLTTSSVQQIKDAKIPMPKGPCFIVVWSQGCGACTHYMPTINKVTDNIPLPVTSMLIEYSDLKHVPLKTPLNPRHFPWVVVSDGKGGLHEFDGDRSPEKVLAFVKEHTTPKKPNAKAVKPRAKPKNS